MSPWTASYSKPVASYLLFLNITDNDKAVKNGLMYKDGESEDYDNLKPPQRYHKYANGGLKISSLAYKIYNKINKAKFKRFLEAEASGSILKRKLFQNFYEMKDELKNDHLFDDPQKIFDDISDAFIEVIEDAAKEYKNCPRNNPRKVSNEAVDVYAYKTETTSTNNNVTNQEQDLLLENMASEKQSILTSTVDENHNTINNINTIVIDLSSKDEEDLKKLKDSIDQLYCHFKDLKSDACMTYIMSNSYDTKEEQEEQNKKEQEIKNRISDFINENRKLRYYRMRFSELKEKFEEMIALSDSLTFLYWFKAVKGIGVEVHHDPTIDEYDKCITEIQTLLYR